MADWERLLFTHIHSDHQRVIRVSFVNNVRRWLYADAEFRAGQEQASLSGADVNRRTFVAPRFSSPTYSYSPALDTFVCRTLRSLHLNSAAHIYILLQISPPSYSHACPRRIPRRTPTLRPLQWHPHQLLRLTSSDVEQHSPLPPIRAPGKRRRILRPPSSQLPALTAAYASTV